MTKSLDQHLAKIVVLECMISSTARLFTAPELETDSRIPADDLRMLRETRDKQVEALRQNLIFAKQRANR
jgi:hypothetical protein